MTWFRCHRRCGSWLALLALALQLALSFGHVHLDAAAPVAFAAAATDAGGIATPGGPNRGDKHDGDYCAICAVLALLNGAQVATTPAVLLPVPLSAAVLVSTAEAAGVAAPPAAFLARGPPLS